MYIVHIVWGMGIGGTENMLADIMNKQANLEKISLIIIDDVICNNIISRIDKRIKIFYINRKKGQRSILSVIKLNWRLLLENPDVIHCHTPSIINVIFVKKLISATFCVTCHDTQIPFNNYYKYDKVFTISNAVKNDLEERYNQQSTVIINGIDFDHIKRKTDITNTTTFLIVQVSRLDHEKKGQELMLKALEYLVFTLGLNNIEYITIGDGPSREYLIKCSAKLKVDKYCKFIGSLDRNLIYSTLKNYDLLVQPSFFEGFGLTVVEGMAANLPVLVSNIEGPRDIVKNGKYGYVFESGNAIDLAYAIRRIIADSRTEEFSTWIDKNFEYIKNNYDVNNTALTYLKEY